MYDARVSGKLHNAGLDVFATEPADPANPLLRLDHLLTDIARHAFTNMQSVRAGQPLPPDDVIVAAGEKE